MDLAVLSSLIAALGSICGLLYAVYTVRRMSAKLETFEGLAESVAGLFRYEETAEGQGMIDPRLDKLIGVFSSSLSKSLRMSFLGGLSGNARLEKGLKGAIAQDIIEEKMPLLDLAGDILGFNTKKYVAKHPDAIGQLVQLAAPILKNRGINLSSLGGGTPSSNNGRYRGRKR